MIMPDRSCSNRLLESGSHPVSQYFGTSTGILEMPCPSNLWHSCSPISSNYHLPASLSALWCIHCGSPGQVLAKHAGPLWSRTDLSWFHLTKECFLLFCSEEFFCHRCYAASFALSEVPHKLFHSISIENPVPPLWRTVFDYRSTTAAWITSEAVFSLVTSLPLSHFTLMTSHCYMLQFLCQFFSMWKHQGGGHRDHMSKNLVSLYRVTYLCQCI